MSGSSTIEKITKTEEEWRRTLSPRAYQILREHGTEPAFMNEYWDNKKKGRYLCKGCGLPLFDSTNKFDSRTGWPSFWKPIDERSIETTEDRSHGMLRTEAKCARCGGHLGHVFKDGPPPTGLRYSMNSGALDFIEER